MELGSGFLIEDYQMALGGHRDTYHSLNQISPFIQSSGGWAESSNSKESSRRKFFSYTLIFMISLSISLVLALFFTGKNVILKSDIQNKISKLIEHGGDIRAIKHEFKSSPIEKVYISHNTQQQYYSENVALSTLLDDLRTKFYREGNKQLIEKIDPIIKIYETTNPFDKVASNQKDILENIRIKSGDNYEKISNDINNLADELSEKNKLVDEYLADSKLSFWISVIALAFSITISTYQIYSSRYARTKELLTRILLEANRAKEV